MVCTIAMASTGLIVMTGKVVIWLEGKGEGFIYFCPAALLLLLERDLKF